MARLVWTLTARQALLEINSITIRRRIRDVARMVKDTQTRSSNTTAPGTIPVHTVQSLPHRQLRKAGEAQRLPGPSGLRSDGDLLRVAIPIGVSTQLGCHEAQRHHRAAVDDQGRHVQRDGLAVDEGDRPAHPELDDGAALGVGDTLLGAFPGDLRPKLFAPPWASVRKMA